MNRELKFRAWVDAYGVDEMVYDYCFLNKADNHFHAVDLTNERPDISNVKAIMQFTGLHDKNGTPIYENDICRLFSCNRPIEFQEGSFGYMTELNSEKASFIHISNRHFNWVNGKSDKIEVIGNLYQNPELLIQ